MPKLKERCDGAHNVKYRTHQQAKKDVKNLNEFIYTEMTNRALALMCEKHKNQVDKAGMPYILHPFTVAMSMPDEITTTIALLHDVVEDTDTTFDSLSEQFPDTVIEALRLLTHDKDVSYEDYIKLIATNKFAKIVKMADLRHNLQSGRLNNPNEHYLKKTETYRKALEYLQTH